jgi:P4 family phage/plasmid primase-like protien
MPEKQDIKKMNKLRERLYDFLEKHRYNENSPNPMTHQSYGVFFGTFSLDKDARREFYRLYVDAVDAGVDNLSILERQKDYAPIIVDVDLEVAQEDYTEGYRLYDDDLIENIISKYIEAINTYLDVPDRHDALNAFLFEKQQPSEKETCYKDGFHLVFPNICAHSKVRHLLRYKVVKLCEDEGTFESFANIPEKIIDKSVVSSNGWFLYGSRKPGGQIYELTKVYNKDAKIIYDHPSGIATNPETGTETYELYTNDTLIRYLSVQSNNYRKNNATPLQEEYVDSDIDAECEKLGINSSMKAEQFKLEIPADKEDEARRANKYTSMLNEFRASDYHEWIRVGLALHNISDALLPTWIEFSKKCMSKFKQGECERNWRTMKNPANGNVLTIRSLAYWAKQDNPKEYEAFNKEEFKNMLRKSLDGNTYYLAKSFHSKYSDRFVCSSIKNNTWWQFRKHRWERIEGGYTLTLLFSEDFANEYNREIAEISIKATTSAGIEKEELQQRRMRIDKIVEKLMNTTFKKTLLEECKSLFYDGEFEQKLDSNIHLIGFDNGVYDLESNVFRDGKPDDYITLSTHNDYYKWNEKNPYNKAIFGFFDQVMPNPKVKNYFLNALSTCLSGENKEEKLYIMNGNGSNGKSLTMDLMSYSLGDYYMSCPITIITRKRGQSNETSPEKVRMKGRRCGVFQETDDGEKLNVGVMKEFTGGDKVLVRDLFKGSNEMIEFKPQMKYFLTCNQLPNVPSNDDGTWRRLRVINFGSKFVDGTPTKPNEFKKDNTLKQKIHAWGPTFISYLIHIYATEYKAKKYLEEPEEVLACTNAYKMENDVYTEYINDNIEVTGDPKNIISEKSLYEDFKIWYKAFYNDNKNIPKKLDFVKVIVKVFEEAPNKKGYRGIIFKSHIESGDEKPNELDV